MYLRTSTDKGHTFEPEITLTDTAVNATALYPQMKDGVAKLMHMRLKVALIWKKNVYVVANGGKTSKI